MNVNKEQALDNFWQQFGLTAYDENRVPSNTTFPYLTYQANTADFGQAISATASLFYQSNNWKEITEKARHIEETIGRGGIMIACDDGGLWIKKGRPFTQRMKEQDDSIRRVVLNIEIEFIT